MGSLILELHVIPTTGEKASVWLCHQGNLFSFHQIFLKFADKMNMDEIWDEFENWPD